MLLATALTGCASVPFSTMWKLRGMTPERFFAGDPREMRVAIRSDDIVKRGAGQPQIRIDIEAPSTKPICYAFALDAVDARAAGEPPLEAVTHRRWYAFALSRKGIEVFDRAKREVRVKELKGGQLSFAVTFDDLLIPPDDAKALSLRIDIALDRKDGYVTLIKEFDIPITRTADAAKKPAAPATEKTADAKPTCVPID
jgi:hypothetical protein